MVQKLIMIVDDSTIYLDKRIKDITEKWNFSYQDCLEKTEWTKGCSSNVSLFQTNFVHLNLRDKNNLKKFVELINNRKKNNLFSENNWFGNGLIITTTHQQGATKIFKLIEEFGGKVYKKEKGLKQKQELLKEIKCSNEIKQFISDYVGDDYDLLISIKNNISGNELTMNNLHTFLPHKPGAVPPWDYVDSVLFGNTKLALKNLERTLENNFYLVVLAILKSKFNTLYQYTLLNTMGVKNNKEKAKLLGLKSHYVFISMNKMVKSVSLQTCEYINNLLFQAESDLKGGSRINPKDYLNVLTTKIIIAINNNKPLN